MHDDAELLRACVSLEAQTESVQNCVEVCWIAGFTILIVKAFPLISKKPKEVCLTVGNAFPTVGKLFPLVDTGILGSGKGSTTQAEGRGAKEITSFSQLQVSLFAAMGNTNALRHIFSKLDKDGNGSLLLNFVFA